MSDRTERRVRRVVERELAGVESPETAEAVLDRAEQLAAGATEEDAAQLAAAVAAPPAGDAAGAPPAAAGRAASHAIVEAARTAPGEAGLAAALVETAAQSVAPTPAAEAVTRGAQAAMSPAVPSPLAADRGRALLQEAALRRMGRRDSLDARIFLAVNGTPHPAWLDRMVEALTFAFRGGWVWLLGLALAGRLGLARGGPSLPEAAACILGTTWIAEYPIKAFFRRRRPFADVIRAVVVGKKPGSWSFPSGHTASAFAAAATLAAGHRPRAPALFGLAAAVGLSRVYAGAHYPGDVLSGAFLGVTIAGVIRTALLLLRSAGRAT
ncbi:MAG TPA: phosphatase PAP2 family protein [Chloroflexota bacterium]